MCCPGETRLAVDLCRQRAPESCRSSSSKIASAVPKRSPAGKPSGRRKLVAAGCFPRRGAGRSRTAPVRTRSKDAAEPRIIPAHASNRETEAGMVDSMEGALPRAAGTVVVGAGPAGAVMAARLAEAGEDVLLLEAGPDYGPPSTGDWPERLLDPTLMPVEEVSWEYTSACRYGTPDMALQRARVMGGCSSHNGCAAVWGHRSDYDAWAVANPGWSDAEVEPLFREVNARLRVVTPPRAELTPFHQSRPGRRGGRRIPLHLRSLQSRSPSSASPSAQSISIPRRSYVGTPRLPTSTRCATCRTSHRP